MHIRSTHQIIQSKYKSDQIVGEPVFQKACPDEKQAQCVSYPNDYCSCFTIFLAMFHLFSLVVQSIYLVGLWNRCSAWGCLDATQPTTQVLQLLMWFIQWLLSVILYFTWLNKRFLRFSKKSTPPLVLKWSGRVHWYYFRQLFWLSCRDKAVANHVSKKIH
jgi:hypothetical protein